MHLRTWGSQSAWGGCSFRKQQLHASRAATQRGYLTAGCAVEAYVRELNRGGGRTGDLCLDVVQRRDDRQLTLAAKEDLDPRQTPQIPPLESLRFAHRSALAWPFLST